MVEIKVIETAKEKRQKFIRVQRHPELHITACAVSKMANADRLSELEEYKNYLVEPNQKWLENPADERAWVKIYYKLDPKNDSVIEGRAQTILIPMIFWGEGLKECWAELQIMIKKFETVKLGRHQSYDIRIREWLKETKPIVPKKDAGTHGYIALRFYHQDNFPKNQPDWHFEPVYAAIAGKDFYRIDAIWQNEEIKIAATFLNTDSPEIPKFLRR